MLLTIYYIIMESNLYVYPRYGKGVKFISRLTKYINTYKIPIILPRRQTSTLASILKSNTTNYLDLLSDNFEKDISPKVPNNNKEDIRSANITANDN